MTTEVISEWAYLTDPVLLKIFFHLSASDIINAGATCQNWNRISYDDLLWRHRFRMNFNILPNIGLKPGRTSWFEEYKRLVYHAPLVETEVLKCHGASVLHVNFSHDGMCFVTCSTDGLILVYNSSYPASIKISKDMKPHNWKFTQYSEFNESDTLLLVSGSHFGKIDDSSGEIAVFSMEDDDMPLICRIFNQPYDIFGTFYSESFIFSGQAQQIGNLICSSSIWMYKAIPDVEDERKPLMNRLFRFLNVNASFIRTLMVATCKTSPIALANQNHPSTSSKEGNSLQGSEDYFSCSLRNRARNESFKRVDRPPWFIFEKEYLIAEATVKPRNNTESSESESISCSSGLPSDCDEEDDIDSDEELAAQPDKYLIFTTGYKANTPHQIGIKRISQVQFPKKLDPGPSIAERIEERRQRAQRPPVAFEDVNIEELSKNFDSTDRLIEMHGHIIGMKLSPDHRYLYVNCRPWPTGYVIANPLDPPPVAQEIDIHVIDLTTFKEVGVMLRSHKAFTPSEECFVIFLDVCDEYIASGSEDRHGYLWDRHYGIGLAKYPHADVVNGVAFNPKDSGMLVTVSDDHTIKIWRSRARTAELNICVSACPRAIKISPKRSTTKEKRAVTSY